MLPVSTTGAEVQRGAVYPMVWESTPTLRSPRRIAAMEAPGTQLRNASMPRSRSSVS
ncbi:hypothetical protein BG846_05566 [Streptomyces fradiae ATCC 10745 = DSM 40063]|uniref:Uncharacterized protein n=1 Tax=Streptomyces fradiae ATCC 10745 = DSM 40063 TaxID=1319510 RepID=A0A1Y2NMX6_STRFR|nr:hypothetical protein BG846_05566 [Streptomyces fradiae ATCC 10745 = DSM 40063]